MKPSDVFIALTVVFIWSLNYSVNKFAVDALPPFLLLAVRYVLLAAILAPMLRGLERPLGKVAGVALSLGVLHFGLFFVGLQGVNAGLAGLVVQLAVPFGAVLGRMLFGERIGALQVIGMAVAFGGLYFVVGQPEMAADPWHLAAMIASALAFAVAAIQVKRLGPIHPLRLNAWVFVLSMPVMFALTVILETDHWRAAVDAGWQAWAATAWTGIAGVIVGYSLWYRLLDSYAVNRVVPFMLLVPALGMLLAGVILDEPLTAGVLGGGALTIVGVGLIQFGQRSRKGAET